MSIQQQGSKYITTSIHTLYVYTTARKEAYILSMYIQLNILSMYVYRLIRKEAYSLCMYLYIYNRKEAYSLCMYLYTTGRKDTLYVYTTGRKDTLYVCIYIQQERSILRRGVLSKPLFMYVYRLIRKEAYGSFAVLNVLKTMKGSPGL
jgi:hypothetical protein